MSADGFLTGLWYLACPSTALRPGRLIRRMLFGEPVALGRTASGEAFAMRDVCPHRAAPLSAGRIVERDGIHQVECPYHGWRFRAADGRCAAIPALPVGDAFDPTPIRTQIFPVREAAGLVWIAHGAIAAESPPPDIGVAPARRPKTLTIVAGEGPYDEAVTGLIDPAHTPFVHRQWWWREGKALADKEKRFEPTALGFRMPTHPPSSNSRIYGFLGGAPTTEIEFRLPGLRIETIRTGSIVIVGVTAITPTDAGRSAITHAIYWNAPALDLLRPLAAQMARNFLGQDGAILRAQNQNLSRLAHRPLYAGDPDRPAQWYAALKRAWAARTPDAPFVNPVAATTLRWRT